MISYPVDVANDRFTFRQGAETVRNKKWPRTDGMPLQGADPGLIIMQEFIQADPAYDPATQRLDDGAWVDDEPNQATTFVRSVVALTQDELDEIALAQDTTNKRQALDNAVATLRQWSVDAQGTVVGNQNNNAVTQTLVDRLGIAFDRLADLLETYRRQ